MIALVLACTPSEIELGPSSRISAPGITAETDATVAPAVLWTKTWFSIKLAIDEEGNLLADQPTGEYQPQVSMLITSERLTDVTHNGWLEESFGGRDYVTVSVVDLLRGWVYDSSQIRDGLQVMQVNTSGEVVGYMQPVEGNSEVAATYERCDGCDPP